MYQNLFTCIAENGFSTIIFLPNLNSLPCFTVGGTTFCSSTPARRAVERGTGRSWGARTRWCGCARPWPGVFWFSEFQATKGKRETGAAPGRFRRRLLMSLYVSTDIVFSLLFCLDSVQTFGASNCYGSKHVIGDSREYCNWLNFESELAILEMKEEIY